MLHSPKKIIILLLIFTLTGILGYFFLSQGKPEFYSLLSKNSIFKGFSTKSDDTEVTPEFPQITEKDLSQYAANITELQKIFNSSTNYWGNWSWENKMIEAQVLSVNKEDKIMTFEVSNPKNNFVNDKKITAHIECPYQVTAMVSALNPTERLIDAGFEFFDVVKPDMTLFTYCMNSECTTIGNRCVLVEENVVFPE